MSYPIFAAVFYICLQFHDNYADEVFQISKTRMTWKETDRHCRNKTGSCLVTKQAAEWRRLGTPSGVNLHTPVWVGARYLEKLVWELNQGVSVDFFQFVGCYSIASRPEPLHDGVHAPYQCYERCGRTTMYMFLQNEVCFCTNNISIYRSHDVRCDTTCSDSLHTCGGKGDYFSGFRVMKNIILDARTWDAPCFFGKLQDEDKQKVLFINGTSGDSNRYELMLSSEFRVTGIDGTLNCTKKPQTFVNAKQHASLNHFGTIVTNTPSDRIYNSMQQLYPRFLNETLWLPLHRVGHLYWSNGKRFAESIKVSKGKVYECVSAQFDYNGSVEFESRSCNDVLDFICSCDIITEGYKAVHGESESKKGGGDKKTECPHDDKNKRLKKYAVPLAGAVIAIAVAPMVVSAMGFGAGGVVAGTAAAKMASLAATAGYGSTVVAGLQSVGAAGYSVLGNAALGMAGAVAAIGTRNVGRKVSNKFKRKQTKDMENEKKNDS